MKPTQKQFTQALNRLSREGLSDTDKQEMLAQITGVAPSAVRSPYTSWSALGRKAVAAISIASVGFGSLAFASTSSLPDELLYPVKTEIIEPLVELTKLSVESRQAYQIDLAHERLEELIELEEQGELDAGLRTEVESDFIAHVAEADSYPESESSQEALELAVRAFIAVASEASDSAAEQYITDPHQSVEVEVDTPLDADGGVEIQLDASIDTSLEEPLDVDETLEEATDTLDVINEAPEILDAVGTQTDSLIEGTLPEVTAPSPTPSVQSRLGL